MVPYRTGSSSGPGICQHFHLIYYTDIEMDKIVIRFEDGMDNRNRITNDLDSLEKGWKIREL